MAKLQEKLATVHSQIRETQEKLVFLRNQLPQLEASLFALQGQQLLLQDMIKEEAAQAEEAKRAEAEPTPASAVEEKPAEEPVKH